MTVSEIKTMRKDNVVINRRYELLTEPNIRQLSNKRIGILRKLEDQNINICRYQCHVLYFR